MRGQEDSCGFVVGAAFALGLALGAGLVALYHQLNRPPTPQERVQEIAERALEEVGRLRKEVMKRLDQLRRR